MKDQSPKSKHRSAPEPQHDSPSRMDRPIAGNPSQRKNQVQGIANDVFTDHMERDLPQSGDDLTDGNYQPESAHSPVTGQHPTHTHHDHTTGHSHTVAHGQPCPTCGTEYIG